MFSVLIARVWTEVKQRSKSSPFAAISSPAARASAAPFSVTSTSHQPVKRFSRFHADWPWRIRTRRGIGTPCDGCRRSVARYERPATFELWSGIIMAIVRQTLVYDGPGGPFEGVIAYEDEVETPRPGVLVVP